MKLKNLGWNEFFQKKAEEYTDNEMIPGRISIEHKGLYSVYTEHGELLANISGKMLYDADHRGQLPAVGDWVLMVSRLKEKKATIKAILPRKSKFSRKVAGDRVTEQIVAANIDFVFLVISLNNDFNLRRIERYLTLIWDSGATPVVVLNKADLCDDIEGKKVAVEAIAQGVAIHVISCMDLRGINSLREYCQQGKTIALLGSSGVGKSTLINKLLGEERQKTREVREKDDKGKHTTTHRELIILNEGGLIIDTPGMREIQLWDSGTGINETFNEIEELARKCKFNDCQHDTEPGCALKKLLRKKN